MSLRVEAPPIRLDTLHASLADPLLESMNLLNEVAQRYPQAISFAAGRPHEGLFDLADLHRYLDVFAEHLRSVGGSSEEEVTRALFQYGRTKGIVHDLIAEHLAVDEGIAVDPEAIVVTVGCQEAMYLTLRALRRDERDVVLAVSPTYVGLAGAARLADMPVLPVPAGPDGVDRTALATTVRSARAAGWRPRAFYVIPDFSNPLGVSLDRAGRHDLLRTAAELDLLLLEDNPYGIFSAGAERLPTLKALDTEQRVVYLGSFAKTALPGARIGYLVADQRVTDDNGADLGLFADQLAKLKSMLTVNTSPVAQAVVAGKLLAHGGSLLAANRREIEVYRTNLARVLAGLATRFPAGGHGPRVSWNLPGGGFFLVLTVPFRVDDALLEHSARRHGVLWTPMHHFYADGEPTRQIRLAYSAIGPDEIDTGLDRLAALIHEQTTENEQ